MVKYTYYFDTLIPAVNLRKIPILEKNDIKVDVAFNKVTLNFTPSRLNLLHFCPNTGTNFENESETLREDLEKSPLKVTVYYKDAIVGEAVVPWPDKILKNIQPDEGSDILVDGANAELILNEEVVGCVELIVRLQCLCSLCDPEAPKAPEEGEEEDENPATMILEDDILFIMDDSEKCGQTQSPDDLETECTLNLSKYREINGKTLVCPSLKNTCTSPQCLALKDMNSKFEKIVEKLVCAGIQDLRVNKKPPCGSPCSPKEDACPGAGGCSASPFGNTNMSSAAPCGSSFEQSRSMSGMSNPYGGGQNCSDKKRTDCTPPNKNGCSFQVAIACPTPNECTIKCSKQIAKSWLNKSNTPQCDHEENSNDCNCMKSKKNKSSNCPICKELQSTCPTGQSLQGPRNCRFCYDDISWLPEKMPCPKCGNRPTSSLKKEYRDTLKMIRRLTKRENCS